MRLSRNLRCSLRHNIYKPFTLFKNFAKRTNTFYHHLGWAAHIFLINHNTLEFQCGSLGISQLCIFSVLFINETFQLNPTELNDEYLNGRMIGKSILITLRWKSKYIWCTIKIRDFVNKKTLMNEMTLNDFLMYSSYKFH